MSREDYTVSIICSAIAVEAALTRVYLKWIELERYRETKSWLPFNETERENCEEEYRRKTGGGFTKTANFVFNFLANCKFDEFIASRLKSTELSGVTSERIEADLFKKRNRLLHWGNVDWTEDQAASAFVGAQQAFGVVKHLDEEKFRAMQTQTQNS